jgi:Fe-S oxidoreductase
MREEAVKLAFGPMPEQARCSEHAMKENNPYMENHTDRLNWLPSHIKQTPDAKLAYFVGCTSSYREQGIAIATAEILNSPLFLLNAVITINTKFYIFGSNRPKFCFKTKFFCSII